MQKLLVVDDEPNVLYSLQRSLQSDVLQVLTAQTARQGIETARQERPDAVLLDVRLPDMSGLDAFEGIRQVDPRLPVIVMTAYASADTAIEAMKRGAFEYLVKPVDLHQLREVVANAVRLSHLTHVPPLIDDGVQADGDTDRIVGRSAVMQEVYKAIGRVSPLDVNVLILGESGTGKELVARAIFHHSHRSNKPFLAINCAAIPETLLESELFGHERGAFTSANQLRIGKFEQANGGTIFLDEIGDMSSSTQAKVLRVLQDQTFQRVGGNETNQSLEQAVTEGRFRQDLYYRLKVYTILVPPLRDRHDDLAMLADHYIRAYSRELGLSIKRLAPESLAALTRHRWPGNVRELQSAIKFALVNCRGDVLTPECLPESCRSGSAGTWSSGEGPASLDVVRLVRSLLASNTPEVYREVLSSVDRVVLEEVLRHTHGNQVEASQLLGISRTTLRAKLQTLGLAVEKQVLPDSAQDDQTLNRN
jgi:DNA-binding NtrC family response regulator